MALSTALLAWTLAYLATCIVVVARTRAAHRALVGDPAVLLVRPCAGAPELVARSLPVPPRDMPTKLRWVAALDGPADAAWAPALRAREHLLAHGVDAHVLATAALSPNHKVGQLAAAIDRFGDGRSILVVADADVALDAVDLRALIAPLTGARPAAACWSAPVEGDGDTFGDQLSAAILSSSLQSFVLLAVLDRRLFVGKLFAVRMAALAAVGGMARLGTHLGEDFELARRLRARGGEVVVAPGVARSLARGRSFAAVLDRYTRWLTVVRTQRPLALLGYPLLLAPAPLLLAFAIVASASAPVLAASCATAVVLARLAVVVIGRRRSGLPLHAGALALALPVDAFLLLALARCLLGRPIRWADRTLRLGEHGRLERATEAREPPAGEAVEHARGERPRTLAGPRPHRL
jgi:ceramide glucosyltransferase